MSSKQSWCESLISSTNHHKYTQSQVLLTMPEIPLAKKKKKKKKIQGPVENILVYN